jgi:hypothetical protein
MKRRTCRGLSRRSSATSATVSSGRMGAAGAGEEAAIVLAPPTIGTARPSGDQGMAGGRWGGRWSSGSALDPGARLIGSGSAVYLPIDFAQAEAGTGGELQLSGGLTRQQPCQIAESSLRGTLPNEGNGLSRDTSARAALSWGPACCLAGRVAGLGRIALAR